MSSSSKGRVFFGKTQGDSPENNRRVKTLNIILSIAMAIILWAYVIGEVNPETERTLDGVSLNVVGEMSLKANDMVVLTDFDKTITAVIEGKRNSIYNISAGQLTARVDLTGCVVGENTVDVLVVAPKSVSDAYAKEESITVVVDKVVTEPKNVHIDVAGNGISTDDVNITGTSFETINVTGPSTYVSKVYTVNGTLRAEKGYNAFSQTVELTPVDKNGNRVKGVTLEAESVEVAAQEKVTKTITVPVEVTGLNEEKYTYNYPQSVNISVKGTIDEVERISYLTVIPADLTWATEDMSANLDVIIPDGLTAVDSAGNPIEINNGRITVKIDIDLEEKNPASGGN